MTVDPAEHVRTRPAKPAAGTLEADARRLRRFAELMDGRFEVAGVRFGYDSLIGLVPGIGDLATAGAALYPVYLARKHRLGNTLALRMLGNVTLDFVAGSVPLVGDLFDVAFKANVRNRELFERAVAKRREAYGE